MLHQKVVKPTRPRVSNYSTDRRNFFVKPTDIKRKKFNELEASASQRIRVRESMKNLNYSTKGAKTTKMQSKKDKHEPSLTE